MPFAAASAILAAFLVAGLLTGSFDGQVKVIGAEGEICRVTTDIPVLGETEVWHGFDGDPNTVFHSTPWATLGTIQFDFYGPTKLTAVSPSPQTDLGSRMPKRCLVQGSPDASEWVTLLEINGLSRVHASGEMRIPFEKTGSYRYYRLSIPERNGDMFLAFKEMTFHKAANWYLVALAFLLIWVLVGVGFYLKQHPRSQDVPVFGIAASVTCLVLLSTVFTGASWYLDPGPSVILLGILAITFAAAGARSSSWILVSFFLLIVDISFGCVSQAKVLISVGTLFFVTVLLLSSTIQEARIPWLRRFRLPTRWEYVSVALVLSVAYFWAYHQIYQFQLFSTLPEPALFSGSDQDGYLRMAKSMANLDWFKSGVGYLRGPGYPILGAPFVGLLPSNPFFVAQFLVYVAGLTLLYALLLRATTRAVTMGVVAMLALQSPLFFVGMPHIMGAAFYPWNNVVAFLVSCIFLWCLLTGRPKSLPGIWALGVALGWVYASRYGDIVYFSPMALWLALHGRPWKAREIATGVLALLLGAFSVIGPTLLSHRVFYGGWFTTYHNLGYVALGGEYLYPFDFKMGFTRFVEVFLFPFVGEKAYRGDLGIFAVFTIAVFFISGLWFQAKKGVVPVLVALSLVLGSIWLYLTSGAVSSVHIKFQCGRYFLAAFPFLAWYSGVGIHGVSIRFLAGFRAGRARGLVWSKAVWLLLPVFGAFLFLDSRVPPGLIQKAVGYLNAPETMAIQGMGKASDVVSTAKVLSTYHEPDPTHNPLFHPYKVDGQTDLYVDLKLDSKWPIRVEGIFVSNNRKDAWLYQLEGSLGLPADTESKSLPLGWVNDLGRQVFYVNTDAFIYHNYLLSGSKKIRIYLPMNGSNGDGTEYFVTVRTGKDLLRRTWKAEPASGTVPATNSK